MQNTYLSAAIAILQEVEATQSGNIATGAGWIADAIEAGGMAHFFGAGHSHMALEEVFPRNGGLIGLHPLTELALSYYTPVVGNSGIYQMRFYQQVAGLGEIIWKNYRFRKTDCFVVYTNTGVTKVALDIAELAKAEGMRVIAVTSLKHAAATGTEHKGGKRLHEIADLVIDNCSVVGDAMVEVPGSEDRAGAGSSVTSIAITNALATEAALELSRRGVKPMILPSPYFEGTPEARARRARAEKRWDECIAEYSRRYAGMFAGAREAT
jgi:uncharacterized phosphosugar-binding protein